MTDDLVFHSGEQAMQRRAGVRERSEQIGPRAIRDHLDEQHRAFFAQLPWVVAATVDATGQPWVGLLAGVPGFIEVPTARQIHIAARPAAGDPLLAGWGAGRPVGLLGIELHTRRRNRLNGWVSAVGSAGFDVDIQQSFGNCPQHIRPRQVGYLGPSAPLSEAAETTHTTALDSTMRRLIERADTMFIASTHPAASAHATASQGVDVSHRGGLPGFIEIDGSGALLMPDYPGNGYFNTLGNLTLEPRAGLLFIDFSTGELLHVAVHCEVVWQPPGRDVARLILMRPYAFVRRRAAIPLTWREA